jgi:hypothetical protein
MFNISAALSLRQVTIDHMGLDSKYGY